MTKLKPNDLFKVTQISRDRTGIQTQLSNTTTLLEDKECTPFVSVAKFALGLEEQ